MFFSFLYQRILRPVLFWFDPECVHDFFLGCGALLGKFSLKRKIVRALWSFADPRLETTVAGLPFKNPIGLSAGFDKDAKLINIIGPVGFGFMTLGSVTAKPYAGNPKPRLYRLPKSQGLVVNYGLKNNGAEVFAKQFARAKLDGTIRGISIAKTNTPETASAEAGVQDYRECFKAFIQAKVGDFYELNISCPNAFGGEPFTTPELLKQLLYGLSNLNFQKPVFIKMPINLSWDEFEKLLLVAKNYAWVTGLTIGNLNKNRQDEAIKDTIPENIKGNVSGKPCEELANNLIQKTYAAHGERFVIIGVGGVFSAQDAYKKIRLGASLVGLITGMIYQGPQLIGQINRELVGFLKRDGFKTIGEAVGADNRGK
jgi:dihydroorotate dehydrogenase subfamily 2